MNLLQYIFSRYRKEDSRICVDAKEHRAYLKQVPKKKKITNVNENKFVLVGGSAMYNSHITHTNNAMTSTVHFYHDKQTSYDQFGAYSYYWDCYGNFVKEYIGGVNNSKL